MWAPSRRIASTMALLDAPGVLSAAASIHHAPVVLTLPLETAGRIIRIALNSAMVRVVGGSMEAPIEQLQSTG